MTYMKKNYAKKSFAYAKIDVVSGVRYLADFTSVGFRSQFEASRGFSHTEELWYNELVCLWITIFILNTIYILFIIYCMQYIYIRISLLITVSIKKKKNEFYKRHMKLLIMKQK